MRMRNVYAVNIKIDDIRGSHATLCNDRHYTAPLTRIKAPNNMQRLSTAEMVSANKSLLLRRASRFFSFSSPPE